MKFKIKEVLKACTKAILLVFNGIFMMFGLYTIGFSVVDIRVQKQYRDDREPDTVASNVVMILVSLFLVIIAALGCVGVVRKSAKILYLYVGLLMIMVILELMLGIFVAIQRSGLEISITDWLRNEFFKNSTGKATMEGKTWEELQIEFECCGLNGPEDYQALKLPISLACCPRAYRARSTSAQDLMYKMCIQTESYYSEGCEEEILTSWQSTIHDLFSFTIICFWLEGASMLLASWLANGLKNSLQVYKRTVQY